MHRTLADSTHDRRRLAAELAVGDLIFIRIGARGPFREVARATASWTNHVGIVVGRRDGALLVAESAVPWSRLTPLPRFVARSQDRRIAVLRLNGVLSDGEQRAIVGAAQRRLGVVYDGGFNLHSSRQFCSRYVREVLLEATGVEVGEVETFAELLARQPSAGLGFWKLWYFGRIPWRRQTVTPASVLRSRALRTVFEGAVAQ